MMSCQREREGTRVVGGDDDVWEVISGDLRESTREMGDQKA